MRTARTHLSAAGFTVIEVLAAVVILTIVGWASLESLKLTTRVSAGTVQMSELEQRGHRVVARVARELQQAQLGSLLPDPIKPYGASAITYRCAELDADDTIVWGQTRRLELVPAATDPFDGIDNDSDGLTDEHVLRLVRQVGLPDEVTTVLVTGVAPLLEGEQLNALDDNGNGLLDEPGFSLTRRGGVLEIRLSLRGLDPDHQLITRTTETTVCPRN